MGSPGMRAKQIPQAKLGDETSRAASQTKGIK